MSSISSTRCFIALIFAAGLSLSTSQAFDELSQVDLDKERNLHRPLPEEDNDDPDDPTQPPDDGDTCELIDCGDDGFPDELDEFDGIGFYDGFGGGKGPGVPIP